MKYIIATISKNSYPAKKIEEIIRAGANVLRFNFSHGSPEEVRGKVQVAREVIAKLGLSGKVAILADLPGSKLRLGRFAAGDYPVTKGQRIILKSAAESPDPAQFIPVDFPEIGNYVEPGQVITFGDGELACRVEKVLSKSEFSAEILNDRSVPHMKALNIGRAIDALDHFTPQALAHIQGLSAMRPEWVAFSFVRSGEDMRRWKELLRPHLAADWQPKSVAKLETIQAVDNAEAIAAECDCLMVARGDLGLAAPIENLGLYQKRIVAAAKKAGKEVVVATQILDSLLSYYIPQRAEVLDLTNIVLDGADGIMFAKETGISLTPGRSVETARAIIDAVEQGMARQ